jgi:hypothetical protein
MKKTENAAQGSENPNTAMDYLISLRPGKILRINASRLGGKEVYGYGGEGYAVKDGETHIVPRNLSLSVPTIRALPYFDFRTPQVIAIQLNHFLDNKPPLLDVEREIDKACLEHSVRNSLELDDLDVFFELTQQLDRRHNTLMHFYQFVSFPLSKRHVEGLLKVAEDFYNPNRSRLKFLKESETRRKNLEESLLNDLNKSLRIFDLDRKKWGRGDSVDYIMMGDREGMDDRLPINKYGVNTQGKLYR